MAWNIFFKRQKQIFSTPALSDFDNLPLKFTYLYYKSIKKGNALPKFSDFDFSKLGTFERYCGIILHKPPQYFQYVELKERLISLYGKDLTGQTFETAYSGKNYEYVMDIYQKVCENDKPLYARNSWNTLIRTIGYYSLLLPFERNADGSRYIVTCITPSDLNIKYAKDWQDADDIKTLQEIADF
ncbi:MAG: hypothetical protein CL565_05525 [Alphaproteobacteria bacterium]|nr:hypothetical protein [Alphaproteobacteria bacterium]